MKREASSLHQKREPRNFLSQNELLGAFGPRNNPQISLVERPVLITPATSFSIVDVDFKIITLYELPFWEKIPENSIVLYHTVKGETEISIPLFG